MQTKRKNKLCFEGGRTVTCEPEIDYRDRKHKITPRIPYQRKSIVRKRALAVNRKSPAYFRMIAAGFTIGECRGVYIYMVADGKLLYNFECPFTCVCGKTEYLLCTGQPVTNDMVDVAAIVENIGAVGLKHLRDDGFKLDDIRRIRSAYV